MSNSLNYGTDNLYIGFGIRQLTQKQLNHHCLNISTGINEIPDLFDDNSTSVSVPSFSYRLFGSGCYYIDPMTGEWKSYGMEVGEETNFEYTVCKSLHLTEFAGGFVVLPNAINFDDVFANSSFLQNPTIYTTVIVCFLIYIFAAVWCFFMDRKDIRKSKIHFLSDNQIGDQYFYEITVLTGNRNNSGTKSNVNYSQNTNNL